MNYSNLKLGSPKVIAEAVRYLGLKEIKGNLNNKTIMSWAKDLKLDKVYTSDEVAWCGLFAARVVSKAGYIPVKDPLWAFNWKKFGNKVEEAMLGDILVFTRNGGGHVGFYVAEDKYYYHVLGGNQKDSVSIMRIEKQRCVGIRRCPWKVGQPAEVKKYFVSAIGTISLNES